jgi:ankyrin repeat protein/L-ascorbate metabolism protein UlaG (beta-lactamase superfamily)
MKKLIKIFCFGIISIGLFIGTAGSQDIYIAVSSGDLASIKALIKQDPGLLNAKNSGAMTPLNFAAEQNQYEAAKLLLDMGADPTLGDNENSRPIHLAAVSGSVSIAELLLSKGIDIDSRDINDMTPLLFAASRGKLEMVQFLISRGANVKATTINGFSSLQMAAISGNLDLVKMLVSNDASINARTDLGFTPLHSAASFGRTEVVKYLVDKGADINAENQEGDQPLTLCRNLNCMDAVKYLISKGADVKHKNNEGFTALHNVAGRGTIPLAQLLLDNGADINAASSAGWVPLTCCGWAENSGEISRFLILSGADVNPNPCRNNKECTCGTNFFTPLHAACQWNRFDMMKALVDNGAKVNILNGNGLTPLILAIESGNIESVKYLVDNGAFLNIPEKTQGCSELHLAVAMGYGDIVDFLVEKGSFLDAKDFNGKTPLDYAFYYGQEKIGYDLLAAGANDEALAEYFSRECPLKKNISQGEADIWFLGHSGWAIKTQNHFLVFDYFEDSRTREPDDTCLASGFIVPAELKDLDVTVFSSHQHQDHFNLGIFEWKQELPGINYVLCFNPPGIEENEYIYIPVNEEKEVGDMKIYVNKSTDLGGGFLVEVDGLVIFHMGDHVNRQDDLVPAFTHEIDLIADKNVDIDILFSPIRGCGLGTPSQVGTGIDYALEKLHPAIFVPMHAGSHTFEYRQFAERLESEGVDQAIRYVINKGDRFSYSKVKTTVMGSSE